MHAMRSSRKFARIRWRDIYMDQWGLPMSCPQRPGLDKSTATRLYYTHARIGKACVNQYTTSSSHFTNYYYTYNRNIDSPTPFPTDAPT
jgi:hypothetical protein